MSKKRYSPSEQALLALLRKHRSKPIGTSALTESYYKGTGREPPESARVFVNATLRKLQKKVKINREPFKIERTPMSGPHEVQYWVA